MKRVAPTSSIVSRLSASMKPDLAPYSDDALLSVLRKAKPGRDTDTLAARFGIQPKRLASHIRKLQDGGANIYLINGEWTCTAQPISPLASDSRHVYKSRPDGTYVFGFASDAHLASKYSRLDVLNDLYDRFAAAGVDRVLNAGNWIDGEARFNVHDLLVHGMDAQLAYLAENYPQRNGINTYAVAGDDHEGWYGQKFGIDIGKHAERIMRDAGRRDWFNLGYMEAFVPLQHRKTGQTTQLLVMHPGGGSAYAVSYRPQKIVESFSGASKPAVLLIGHYHKGSYNIFRNVHCIQSMCTQDQTVFMRKKSLEAHVGGGICKLTQDPETGAIVACQVEFFNYFDRGYYNNRWSHGGGVSLPKRSLAA